MNKSWVIATAYRTQLEHETGGANQQRSLIALGDLLVDTDVGADSIKLKGSFEGHWPNGEFSV
jgi:hypothetical protein